MTGFGPLQRGETRRREFESPPGYHPDRYLGVVKTRLLQILAHIPLHLFYGYWTVGQQRDCNSVFCLPDLVLNHIGIVFECGIKDDWMDSCASLVREHVF